MFVDCHPKKKKGAFTTIFSSMGFNVSQEVMIIPEIPIEIKKTKSKTKIKEYSARTNYTCIHCKKSNVMFKIIKNKIEQVCNCENRKHYLDKKIVDKL